MVANGWEDIISMNKTKKLEIKTPCNQSWDEMPVLGEGRYCQSCNHIIMDFSDLSNEELLQILQSGKYSCGRFDKRQMGLVYEFKPERKPSSIYWKGIAAAIVAGTIQLTVMQAQQPHTHKLYPKSYVGIKGDTEVPNVETSLKTDSLIFRIMDDFSHYPIENAVIKIGKTAIRSDVNGRAILQLDTAIDSTAILHITVSKKEYKTFHLQISLLNNGGKQIRINMRKINAHKNREYMLGFY